MKTIIRAALAAPALLLVLTTAVMAQVADTNVHVGATIYDLLIAYASVIGTVVAALASWALWKFTGIKLEANARNAIETFVTNAAGGFLAKYDSIKGLAIDVKNPTIAQLANDGLTRVPDALARFGLGPEDLKKRIVEKIGVLTATPVATPNPAPPVA